MRRSKWVAVFLAAFAGVASLGHTVRAQELGAGRIVIVPGDLVNAGLSRAQAAVRNPLDTPTITETAESIAEFDDVQDSLDLDVIAEDVIRQFAVNVIAQIFSVIANDFLTSLGLPALFPTDFLSGMPALVVPDETGEAGETDQQDVRDTEAPDDGAADQDTSDGRGGRNGTRPRG